jgi:hypothetical protein
LTGIRATNVAKLSDVWPAIEALNLAVTKAYGLTLGNIVYIVITFPVLARKRAAFYDYLR